MTTASKPYIIKTGDSMEPDLLPVECYDKMMARINEVISKPVIVFCGETLSGIAPPPRKKRISLPNRKRTFKKKKK